MVGTVRISNYVPSFGSIFRMRLGRGLALVDNRQTSKTTYLPARPTSCRSTRHQLTKKEIVLAIKLLLRFFKTGAFISSVASLSYIMNKLYSLYPTQKLINALSLVASLRMNKRGRKYKREITGNTKRQVILSQKEELF